MFGGEFGFMAMNFVWVVPLALSGLAVPYLAARMRERNGPPDPHIGVKTAHYFFFSAGVFLMLTGLTLICVELMNIDNRPRGGPFMGGRGPFFEAPQVRVGLAMIISGAIFALMHRLMLLATNDSQFRDVRRAFCGLRLVASGLVVLICTTWILSSLLQVRTEFAEIKPLLAIMIVWAPSWLLHMAFLLFTTPRALSNPRAEQYDD